uniref:MARVEL domain-containing protein n=1 Tax=Panagrellus redivivus TaxID=6233 RepID=A0A7E5A109_PANRE
MSTTAAEYDTIPSQRSRAADYRQQYSLDSDVPPFPTEHQNIDGIESDPHGAYSDTDGATVISQPVFFRGGALSPVPVETNVVLHDFTQRPRTVPVNSLANGKSGSTNSSYTSEIEVNGKIMRFDTSPFRNEEGWIKLAEFALITIALLLSSMVVGVSGEQGFALLVCSFALLIAFAIFLAKVLTLNQLIDDTKWALFEFSICIGIGIAFFIACFMMIFLCAFHWAENNPEWQTMPAFAAVALSCCGLLFFADACIVYYHRRFRSWSPQKPTVF